MVKSLTEQQKAEYSTILSSMHTKVEDCPGMAYEVWEDGEISYTKCSNGVLYGQRTLHCILSGLPNSLPLEIFPERNTFHAFVRCSNGEGAEQMRKFIIKWIES